jgi:DNA-binding transcriptional MerR regulator
VAEHTIRQLSDLAGISPRTVRYYVAQGLLRSPSLTGRGARYDDGHLDRLRLIRRLQRQHLPLAEIRNRLAPLSDEEVQGLVDVPPAVHGSAADYIRSVLATHGTTTRPVAASPTATLMRAPARGIAASRLTAEARSPREPEPESKPGPVPGPRPVSATGPAHVTAAAPGWVREAPPVRRPASGDRSQWERVALAPDIELHVRRPLGRDLNKRVDRLIAAARDILEERNP